MPLSREKGNVSPEVDEGNSRTQHSDTPKEYTPEMGLGECGETLREAVFLGLYRFRQCCERSPIQPVGIRISLIAFRHA